MAVTVLGYYAGKLLPFVLCEGSLLWNNRGVLNCVSLALSLYFGRLLYAVVLCVLNGCLELCFIYTVLVPHVFFYDNVRNRPHSQFTVIFHFIIPLMLMFLATVSWWDICLLYTLLIWIRMINVLYCINISVF